MSINLDLDVHEVMDMVLGDYFTVYVSSLEDQMVDGGITPEEQTDRYIRFSKGCRKICTVFGLDVDVYDVKQRLASKLLCEYYKEKQIDGIENNC